MLERAGKDARAQQLIDYITRRVLKDPGIRITEDTPLVSSALVDSFALVDLLLQLEQVVGRRLDAGRLSPADFETVTTMLRAAERA